MQIKSKASWITLAIMLGIDCGVRRGEILKLNREDINFFKFHMYLKRY